MNYIVNTYKDIKKYFVEMNFGFDNFIALLASSFIIASLYSVIKNKAFQNANFFLTLNYHMFWLVLIVATSLLFLTAIVIKKTFVISWSLLVSVTLYAAYLAALQDSNLYFNLGLAVVIIIVVRYLTDSDKLELSKIKFNWRTAYYVTAVMFILFVIAVAYFTSLKYKTYSNATFDFGIFAQMFEQMRKTGLPNTTIERNTLLSHFAVHFSPIYYLLLPGYMLFPSPYYLFAAQAFFVGLGVFPALGICKKLNLSAGLSTICSMIYLFFPSMADGCFYDFHENKLLSVCILFCVLFIMMKKTTLTIIFAILTLSVKEDAAIYIIAIALGLIITSKESKEKFKGLILLVISILYFIFAVNMIKVFGGSVMMTRLSDYCINGDNSFFGVIKTCFYNVGYWINQVFTKDKIPFVFWMLTPVLFIPFANKKLGILVLLLPMLVINLMPGWLYQYDINYQYTYGAAALIIVAAILTFAQSPSKKRRFFAIASLAICIIFSASLVYAKADRYYKRYTTTPLQFEQVDEVISKIPKNASVSASTFLIPHLYYIDDLNTIPDSYSPLIKTDYYLVDTRYLSNTNSDPISFLGDEYTLIKEVNFLKVYKLK